MKECVLACRSILIIGASNLHLVMFLSLLLWRSSTSLIKWVETSCTLSFYHRWNIESLWVVEVQQMPCNVNCFYFLLPQDLKQTISYLPAKELEFVRKALNVSLLYFFFLSSSFSGVEVLNFFWWQCSGWPHIGLVRKREGGTICS